MIEPRQLDFYSSRIASLYDSLEGEIIRVLIKQVLSGDINQYYAQRASELGAFNDIIVEYLSKVTGVAEPEIKRMFEETGVEVIKSVDGQLPFESLPMPNNIDLVMQGYANQTWRDINNYVNQTLISTNYGYGSGASRAYTDVLNKSQALFNTGIYTQKQALENAVQQLAQEGIKSTFIDKGGHTWSIERYVRTVLKSTLHNTYNQMTEDRMSEYGVHTVRVSQHVGARPACSLIQGEVVDLRESRRLPIDSEYRSVYDPYWLADYREPGGHRGINCGHNHTPFVPGVNINHKQEINPELNEQVAKARDKQRYLERQIVKFKKNKTVSESFGNAEGTQQWQSKISAKQKQMREHLNNNGEYLSRDYSREKVYTPLDTLLKDFSYKG